MPRLYQGYGGTQRGIDIENQLKRYKAGIYETPAARPLVNTTAPGNMFKSSGIYGATPPTGTFDVVRAGAGGVGLDWGSGATTTSPGQRADYLRRTGYAPMEQRGQHSVGFLSRGGGEAPIDPNNPAQVSEGVNRIGAAQTPIDPNNPANVRESFYGSAATVTRTGTAPDGRRVVEYSDGRIEYA